LSAREFVTLRSESANRGAFYVPRFELTIDGVPLDLSILRDAGLLAEPGGLS